MVLGLAPNIIEVDGWSLFCEIVIPKHLSLLGDALTCGAMKVARNRLARICLSKARSGLENQSAERNSFHGVATSVSVIECP